MKLRPAMSKRWAIWVSAACEAQYAKLWGLLRAVVAADWPRGHCNWRLHFGSAGSDFLALKDVHKKQPAGLLALVLKAERGGPPFVGWKNVFCVNDFAERIVGVEYTVSGFGS